MKEQEKALTPEEEVFVGLEEKITALEMFCLKHKLPMYVSVATEPLFENIKYVTKSLTPRDLKVDVSEDRITPLSLSNNKHLKLTLVDDSRTDETELGDLYSDLLADM